VRGGRGRIAARGGPGQADPDLEAVEAAHLAEVSSTPSAAATTAPASAPGAPRPDGAIVAQCAGGLVTLVSWSPDPGYRSDDVSRGPAATASVKFKNGGTENVVAVTCHDGEPRADTVADDHHGGRG